MDAIPEFRRDAYAGIDVACAKRKRLPVCVVVREGSAVIPLQLRGFGQPEPPRGAGNISTLEPEWLEAFASATANYLKEIERVFDVRIRRVAIDAPSDPKPDGVARRRAELALDAAGISCFATPSASEFLEIRTRVASHLSNGGKQSRMPHANQLWMLVGFALFAKLRHDWECLEIYPQAIAKVIGASDLHKTRAGGIEAQVNAMARHTQWPPASERKHLLPIAFGHHHDNLDSYLAAWVASLPPDQRLPFGAPPNDVIWVPRL